ncbi:hypothetical protein BV25DRAFT_1571323 [Artomyces pyxidatus]|uniref:Uncharacterized protein n=1 Tax=Artomyces pyxidatus TaxID=48021 RepID=A0ACB8SKT7_9AGAM|nr:hypothetical protein BV25DRAFT_1571323 [Artomyces pyxidatus]
MSKDSRLFWINKAQARIPSLLQPAPASLCHTSDATRRALEDEVEAIGIIYSLAKRRRNIANAPIYALPAEVLGHIISFAAAAEPPTRECRRFYKLGWIPLTHVCQRWRQVALSSPNLWANIHLAEMHPFWIFEMLRRSMQTPLDLSVDISNPTDEGHIIRGFLLPPVMARVRTMDVDQGYSRYSRSEEADRLYLLHHICSLIPHATQLRSLRMVQDVQDQEYLPRNIFSSGTPNLRTLTLRDYALDWADICLPNLMNLKVDIEPGPQVEPAGYYPTPIQLSDALRRMPLLERLDLYGLFKDIVDDLDHDISDPIELPRLTMLKLTNISSGWIEFAGSFLIPTRARVAIEFCCSRPTPSLSPIFTKYAGDTRRPRAMRLDPLQNTPYTVDSDSSDYRPSCRLTVAMESDSATLLSAPSLSLTVDNRRSKPVARLMEPSSWGGLCLSELEHLVVGESESDVWTKARWFALFGRARSVASVVTHGKWAALSLIKALTPDMDGDEADVVLFPKLLRLQLAVVPELDDRLPWTPGQFTHDALVRCAQARLRRGVPLKHVCIPRQYEQEKWVNRLRRSVRKVGFHHAVSWDTFVSVI